MKRSSKIFSSFLLTAFLILLSGRNTLPLPDGPAKGSIKNSYSGDVTFIIDLPEYENHSPIPGAKAHYHATYHNLVTDSEDKLAIEMVRSPHAPANYVGYPPGLGLAFHVQYKGAVYNGIEIKYCGLLPGNTGGMKLVHYKDDGTEEDIKLVPTKLARDGNCLTGHSESDSLFSLVAPLSMYDKAGPVVTFRIDDKFEAGGAVYVSSSAYVTLSAVDRSSDPFALAGVASTYYLIDAAPTPACMGIAYTPAAMPGSCQNQIYSGNFQLTEGIRSIYFYAVDKIGNIGDRKSTQLRVDSTPPESALKINGLPIASGTTFYAAAADIITLESTDTVSNGVASGLATTYFLIDVSFEDCEYSEWNSGGLNGMGSCENMFYSAPFSLPAGEHVIYHTSKDNVGNKEPLKTLNIVVSTGQQNIDPVP